MREKSVCDTAGRLLTGWGLYTLCHQLFSVLINDRYDTKQLFLDMYGFQYLKKYNS